MHWYRHALKHSFTATGRAPRKAFWLFILMSFIVAIPVNLFDSLLGSTQLVVAAYWLAMLPALISLSMRRLHDTGRSGGWLFLFMIPVLGWLYLFLMMIECSDPDINAYGEELSVNS